MSSLHSYLPRMMLSESEFIRRACQSSLNMSMNPSSPSHSLDCTITKFLNRILGLEVHQQNFLFQYFTNNFEYLIDKDKKEGKYDMGILGKQPILHTMVVSVCSFKYLHSDNTSQAACFASHSCICI